MIKKMHEECLSCAIKKNYILNFKSFTLVFLNVFIQKKYIILGLIYSFSL